MSNKRISKLLILLSVIAITVLSLVPAFTPQPVYAAPPMTQMISGGYNDALNNTQTEYTSLCGGYTWATARVRRQVVSTSGTFGNFAVELSVAPGGGGSYTITLLNVTQATSLAVTIADPATTNINAGTLAVAAGDVIELQSTYADAPTATPKARWSILFTGDNTKESLLLSTGASRTSATNYIPLMHGAQLSEGIETNTYQIIPTSGKIKNLYVALSADPGTNPDAYKFTLRLGNAGSGYVVGDTTLTCTITADDTTGHDTVNEITVAAGDIVDLAIEPQNTPSTAPYYYIGMTFVADTNGESLLLGSSSDSPTTGTTEYNNIVSTINSSIWTATEANVYQGGQSGITLKNLYVMLSGTPGAGKTYQLDIRATSVGGNTGITTSITGAVDTTGNDVVNTYAIGAYDDLSIGCTTTAGSTARIVYWGLVCYIAPVAAPTVTTDAASLVTDTTATLNGTVSDDGGGTIDYYGFVWDTVADAGDPGDVDPSTPPAGWEFGWKSAAGDYGENPFDHAIAGLPTGTTIYYRACAHNAAGWAYGAGGTFLTIPAPPTNVDATDGTSTASVTITWTASFGATSYHIYRDGVDLGAQISGYADAGADPPTITPGTVTASDGIACAYIALTSAGEVANNGTTHVYIVTACNASGCSVNAFSGTNHDTGYRGHDVIVYAWYRSAADADAAYASIAGEGGTTNPYNDVNAPADGAGRWYYCHYTSTDAVAQDSINHDRGWRTTSTIVTEACTGFGEDWGVVNGSLTYTTSVVTTRGFDYGTTVSYTSESTEAGVWATPMSYSIELSSLSPATVYHYRAKVFADTCWYYGADRVFATRGSPVPYDFTTNATAAVDSPAIYSANWSYQTFTTNTTAVPHSVTSIYLFLRRVGIDPGTVTVGIRHTANLTAAPCILEPTGDDIITGYIDSTTISTDYSWYKIDVTEKCLSANTTYAIVVRAQEGTTIAYIVWGVEIPGTYAGGNAGSSNDAGITWVAHCNADNLFQIWGNPCIEVIDAKVF
ncbi:MAG: hypothetical protein PHQ22_10675, partial [Sulfuricurvum sp.]|nr:hypothetical protein [Sulfuricurvum sp.]